MSLLQDLVLIPEGQQLDSLPEDVISEINKNIRNGAKDLQQKWSNALELVHKAYDVSGTQRPTPDMRNAWKQYEQALQYAVQQLAKYRGINGDWRMSSAVFHEALQRHCRFDVRLATPGAFVKYETEARSISELIQYIRENDPGDYEIKTKVTPDGLSAHLQFYRYGVKVKYRVDIEQTGVVGVNV